MGRSKCPTLSCAGCRRAAGTAGEVAQHGGRDPVDEPHRPAGQVDRAAVDERARPPQRPHVEHGRSRRRRVVDRLRGRRHAAARVRRVREHLQRPRRASHGVDAVRLDTHEVVELLAQRVPVPAKPHQPGEATRNGASTGKHSYCMPVSVFSGSALGGLPPQPRAGRRRRRVERRVRAVADDDASAASRLERTRQYIVFAPRNTRLVPAARAASRGRASPADQYSSCPRTRRPAPRARAPGRRATSMFVK